MDDLYQEVLLEHYKNPQNKGSFSGEKNDIKVVKNINVGCGDELTVELMIQDQIVQDIKWNGVGCVISMASMSVLSEYIKGKTIEEIEKIEEGKMIELIGLEEIVPARKKCMMLSITTVQRAIRT